MNKTECKKIIELLESGKTSELLEWAKQQKTLLEVKALRGNNFNKGIKIMLKYIKAAAKNRPAYGKMYTVGGRQIFTNSYFLVSLNKEHALPSSVLVAGDDKELNISGIFNSIDKDSYKEIPINIDLIPLNALDGKVCINLDNSKIFLNSEYIKMIINILGEDVQVFCKNNASIAIFKSSVGECLLMPFHPDVANGNLINPINK